LQLTGGSFVFQITPEDVSNPVELYQRLITLRMNLDQWARQVAACINSNQAISGTTAQRPSSNSLALLPNGGIGYSYFETDLSPRAGPIWWTGSGWVTTNVSATP
jgi:hypothetical protein